MRPRPTPNGTFADATTYAATGRRSFAQCPISALMRCAVDAEGLAWVEWDIDGTFIDGAPHCMRGVSIFGIEQDRFAWVRFYLEPVRRDGINADGAVQHVMQEARS